MQPDTLLTECPFCGHDLNSPISERAETSDVDCPNCGQHQATFDAKINSRKWKGDASTLARIGFAVRQMRKGETIAAKVLDDIEGATQLPSAHAMVDKVLLLTAAAGPGNQVDLQPRFLQAAIGAPSVRGATWAVRQAFESGWIEGASSAAISGRSGFEVIDASLTVKGWERLAELERAGLGSTSAFMAMAFSDDALWAFYGDHMQPAVKATGFDLMTTADARVKKAGSIIARMKVEIRTSRFMVCDLTHGNQGAYWEAGFAEGLGRPVIYTCRADVMTDPDPKKRPHFDTAQQLIVKWDPANPGPGMQELKDVIRATLPAVAKMTDD